MLKDCINSYIEYFVVEDFKLSLSNTGPVILGSNIVFHAQLLAGTGQAPKDESHFKYEWWSTLDLEKVNNFKTY